MPKSVRIDLVGKKFGRLTVIEFVGKAPGNQLLWLCRCECGNEKVFRGIHLKTGHTKSCGCFKKEKFSEITSRHHLSNTRIYKIWNGINKRCNNSNSHRYKDYGGRGIKNNFKDFEEFYQWSMANGYTDNLSIDRIDVDGNYEPNNCRWADSKTQANNKTNSHYITYNGETHTIAEWSRILGVTYGKLQSRIAKGWSVEMALTLPKYCRNPLKTPPQNAINGV